jgi:SAM-dependent methyltransferase
MKKPMVRRSFDKSFYDRYYARSSTAVVTPDEIHRLVKFILSYLEYLGVPVRTVLDTGCGVGLWKRALQRLDRDIEYTGIDSSYYLSKKYGWVRSSIAGFKSRQKYDLVVCQDVLQYAEDEEVRQSIDRIAGLCRGAFYLDVPTKEDVNGGALDIRKTDTNIHLRSVRWYRKRVDRYFIGAGGGVFIPKRSSTVLLALESN